MNRMMIRLALLFLLALIIPAPAVAQNSDGCEFDYTVQAGDWLSKIAEKYYDDPLAYDQIVAAANRDAMDSYSNVEDPNLIEPGWLLCIPPQGGQSVEDSTQIVEEESSGSGLTGTSWQLTSLNGAEVLPNLRVTAVFQTDGTLNGSAGCNNYNSSYQVDGENISIDRIITTLRACTEPEGIMEQEEQYLAALQTAATYKIDGSRMEMRTAGGAKVTDFVAAVTGQVTYRQRIALPPDAVVKIQLQDISLADAPATVIGEQIITTNGQQVPFQFEVTFDPGLIEESHSYSLGVRIEDGAGNLLFINTQTYPVITRNNPVFGVEVLVDQA